MSMFRLIFFFFNDTATTEIYTLSLHDALPIYLADLHGASRIPLYVLNVGFPLVPEELREFCAGKRAVLVVEEGSPDYIEQAVNVELRRADIATRVLGKGMLPRAGEYTSEVLLNALASFVAEVRPAGIAADAIAA